jgi:hypothetical protein
MNWSLLRQTSRWNIGSRDGFAAWCQRWNATSMSDTQCSALTQTDSAISTTMSDFRQLCRWSGVILDTCIRISTAATEPSNLRIRGSMAGCHRGAAYYRDFAPAKLATISAAFGIITGTIGVMVDLPTPASRS